MTRVGCLIAGIMLVAAAGGCELNYKPGTESLLEGLSTTITPGEMAVMAIDPYDPNNRYVWFQIARAFPGRFQTLVDGKWIDVDYDTPQPARHRASQALGFRSRSCYSTVVPKHRGPD